MNIQDPNVQSALHMHAVVKDRKDITPMRQFDAFEDNTFYNPRSVLKSREITTNTQLSGTIHGPNGTNPTYQTNITQGTQPDEQ